MEINPDKTNQSKRLRIKPIPNQIIYLFIFNTDGMHSPLPHNILFLKGKGNWLKKQTNIRVYHFKIKRWRRKLIETTRFVIKKTKIVDVGFCLLIYSFKTLKLLSNWQIFVFIHFYLFYYFGKLRRVSIRNVVFKYLENPVTTDLKHL